MQRVALSAPEVLSFDTLLAEASKRSHNFEWVGAADLLAEALEKLDPTKRALETGRISELLAKAHFNAAFQSKRRDEFRQKMQLAEAAYWRACAAYETAGSGALATVSRARGLFASFWLEGKTVDKSILLKCLELSEEAAGIFERNGETQHLAETHKDVLTYLLQQFWLCSEWKELNGTLEKGIEQGKKAIAEFSALHQDENLLESLNQTVEFLTFVAFFASEQGRFREREKYAETLVAQAAEISKRIGSSYGDSIAHETAARVEHFFKGSRTKALEFFEAAITSAERVQDSHRTGRLLSEAAIDAFWMAVQAEDIEERRALFERAALLSSRATKSLELSSHLSLLAYSYSWRAECETYLGVSVENEVERKKERLQKSIAISRTGLEISQGIGPVWGLGHSLSKALYFLSVLTTDMDEKRQLLGEALPIREAIVKRIEKLEPQSWDNGVMRNYLALIKAELSKIEKNPQTRIELLKGATSQMQRCVDLCTIWSVTPDNKSALAEYMEWYGDILLQLHELEPDDQTSKRALRVYEDTINIVIEAGLVGPIGPIRWKIAKTQDARGNYELASDTFKRAAEDYRAAAAKIPGLASAFMQIASYMDAWAFIEGARVRHDAEQYSLASENYAKAASSLETTEHWKHLSRHYLACSMLEAGEALSRQERPEEAVESLSAAEKSFRGTALDLQHHLKGRIATEEGRELTHWIEVAEGREKYSRGRRDLEEARVHDRKGDEEESSRKYLSASVTFQGLLEEAPNPQTKSELQTLALFCEAWAKMKEAEVKASPELYSNASESFIKARGVANSKKSQLQALANAAICKALVSGTKFRLTQDTNLYSEIKKQMQAALEYYQQAGFDIAANWTRASQRLFDALTYLANAETEIDSKKKTAFYHLAEKYLDLAAKLYGDSGYPRRRDEALKHLTRVREDRELLLSPVEVLAENPAISGASVSPVSLVRDKAEGLERFEAANVVGNMTISEKDLGVGSDLTLELEMANVGKTAATLMKLENIAPEGLTIDRSKIPHRIEDNYLDMKGRRLEYLKTHEVKISMKAVRKGTFELRPRILFVDEKGNYRSYDFEPTALTVRELGISGWLRGPK
jgi:hypothetical protein